VPGADLDAAGVCTFCREHAARTRQGEGDDAARAAREADLEQTLRSCRGQGRYDALVCLSGGKDSIALLYRAKVDYGLNVLAFTTDVNIPDVAWDNIRRAVEKLGVDHLVYRPPAEFYRKIFRHLLRNQEARGAVYTVSYVYAPLFEGDALAVALEKNIPLVLAGYSPGQPEPDRMVYEFSRELICATDWTPPALREAKVLSAAELGRFWNPKRYPPGTIFPRYLAPFHAWPYDQDAIMKRVVELGLVRSRTHASPIYSNYPINWLLMYSDLLNFGYNPYAPEFAALVREGKANRTYWKFLGPIVDFMIRRKLFLGHHVRTHMKWLDLADEDLRITLPKGAYDPVLGDSA
jgi:hypothetical protein